MASGHKHIGPSRKNQRLNYSEGILSIIVNIILFILKYWAGIVSGSVALLADAWHTLSDSVSSLIVIVGIRLSGRKPNRKHPFGHGRWEQIAAIFIAFLLSIIAYEFIREAIERFREGESARFGLIAIVVTVISILFKEGLAQYALYVFRKTGNTSVKADAWHHRSDALSSVLVLIGILLEKYLWWMDSLLSVLIGLLLFWAVFDILKDAISKLLGEKASPELIDQIREVIREAGGEIYDPHYFQIHNYGYHQELTFHMRLPKDFSIQRGHDEITRFEKLLKEKMGIVATIHIEPKKGPDQ